MRLLLLTLLSFIAFANAATEYGHCLLYNGKCVQHCPYLMFPYHTRCDIDTKSQRTCDSPYIFNLGYTCGWSRCDCVNNYVLDDVTGRCVEIKDCSRPSKIRSKKTRRNKSTNKSEGKKIKLKAHDSDDLDYIVKYYK